MQPSAPTSAPNVAADTPTTAAATLSTGGVQYASPHKYRDKGKGTLWLTQNTIFYADETGTLRLSLDASTITKIKRRREFLRLFVGNEVHIFMFPGWQADAMAGATGSLIGMAVQRDVVKNSGVLNWVAALQQLRPDIKVQRDVPVISVVIVGAVILLLLLLMLPALFMAK